MTERERGAHVEIIDPTGREDGPLLPQRVLINGMDVGYVARGGVRIDVGAGDEITQVTLTLLPSRVTIRGVEVAERPISTAAAEYLDRLRASP